MTRAPLPFEVKAEAKSVRGFLRSGRSRLTGVVRARPWADDAPLEGTLEVGPRLFVYDFTFRDEDRLFRLRGEKHLGPTHLLQRMTTLHAELSEGETVLATGTIRFDLNEAPALLSSFSPFSGFRREDLPGTFSPEEVALMRAWTETAIVPGELIAEADEQTHEETLAVLRRAPPRIRRLTKWALRAVDLAARARYGRGFVGLDLEDRRALAAGIGRAGVGGQGLLLLLGFAPKSVHFGRPEYLEAIGSISYDNPVREPDPRWLQQVTPPEELARDSELEADVVIVGTGAGGGPVAAMLAEAGLGVAIVEEGRYGLRQDFEGPPLDRMHRFWRDGGLQFTLGNVPIALPTGKMVGGTTAINSGTCFRTPDAVLAEWRSEGFPTDFSPQSFGRWLDSVEAELQVEPGEARYLGRIAEVVARGAEAMGKPHGPLRRNAPGCDGQGVCAVGCPTDAKRSTNISYIPRALASGAALFTGLKVHRVLMRGHRAVGVEARGQDERGAPRRLRIKARAVVIAAGTLASPLLLHASGVRLPMLGKNLSIHPALGMFGMFEERMEAWNAIPQSYGVEGLVDERVRFEGFYVPPQLAAPLMPVEGPELTRWMDRAAHVAQFGFMVRDRGVGSVRPDSGGRPLIRYDIDRGTLERFRKGSALLAELLLRGGASEVLAGVGSTITLTTLSEARALAEAPLRPSAFRSSAFHPLGTCRMGADAARGVVDFDHKVYGTRNLYVIDGSTVPSSLGVNPQVTIMAMAARAGHRLAAALG